MYAICAYIHPPKPPQCMQIGTYMAVPWRSCLGVCSSSSVPLLSVSVRPGISPPRKRGTTHDSPSCHLARKESTREQGEDGSRGRRASVTKEGRRTSIPLVVLSMFLFLCGLCSTVFQYFCLSVFLFTSSLPAVSNQGCLYPLTI